MKAEYVASISYGKDSIVIPELCKRHNLQLDRLVHIEVMANNDTPACIPIVSEFKKHANDILYDKHGLTVDVIHPEHTFEDMFYTRIKRKSSKRNGQIYGFPLAISSYCVTEFKTKPMRSIYESGAYVYLGLCSDEEKRYNNAHNKNPNILSPAYMFNYTEQDCKEIAKSLDLLSPTYEYSMRDGCFFLS